MLKLGFLICLNQFNNLIIYICDSKMNKNTVDNNTRFVRQLNETKWEVITVEDKSLNNVQNSSAIDGVDCSGLSRDGFVRAVSVWVNKPHVVNRRLAGAVMRQMHCFQGSPTCPTFPDWLCNKLLHFADNTEGGNNEGHLLDINNLDRLEVGKTAVFVRNLIPKQSDRYATIQEVIIFNTTVPSFSFYPWTTPTSVCDEETTYSFTYNDNSIELSIGQPSNDKPVSQKATLAVEWLKSTLLLKLIRWSAEVHLNTSVTSLKLLPVEKYSLKYQELKQKHGPWLVQNWPEKTDPQKFVYEDIAIATYLILLWEAERHELCSDKLQSFVDIGCGNGLLVYLLTAEGHVGLGVDVRKRTIWDMFADTTNLQERTISPSSENLFPEYDWLIGNHSDELTPWIPVIAARSSYHTRYFVLPCCAFDFAGKFHEKVTGVSQYRTYLDYVCQVGQACGFKVQEDTLRIPSTKRVCFIGKERSYRVEEEADIDHQRQAFIDSRCFNSLSSEECSMPSANKHMRMDSGNTPTRLMTPNTDCDTIGQDMQCHLRDVSSVQATDLTSTGNGLAWIKGFQPRPSVERVRNCQTLDNESKKIVVNKVFTAVLEAEDAETRPMQTGGVWRKGGSVSLSFAASLFNRDLMQKLKYECGGIQTLLRNHHNIFQVSGGKVQLRDFSLDNPWSSAQTKARMKNKDKGVYIKSSLCWFYEHHPDGCPRTTENCQFAHGADDLKEVQAKDR